MTSDLLSRSHKEVLKALRQSAMSTRSASSPSCIMMMDEALLSCNNLNTQRVFSTACVTPRNFDMRAYHPATLSLCAIKRAEMLDSRVAVAGWTCWLGMNLITSASKTAFEVFVYVGDPS